MASCRHTRFFSRAVRSKKSHTINYVITETASTKEEREERIEMSATVRDIREKKLVAVARYLDRFPPLAPGQKEEEVEQYYGLLCVELRRLPPPLGAKFTYTRSQVCHWHCVNIFRRPGNRACVFVRIESD